MIEPTLILVQLVVGAIGSNAAGAALRDKSLGIWGNTIAGLAGGGLGGHVLNSLLETDVIDAGTLIQQAAGGGIGGAVAMLLAGLALTRR